MRNRLISTLFRHLPGAWVDPKNNELIPLYRLRYKMALEEQKYDTALIFVRVTPSIALRAILVAAPLGVVAGLGASWTLLRRDILSIIRR